MNKRGQLYLIAAIIIVGIVVGFVAVSNYSKKQDYIRVYDLGEELEIEGAKVLDYETVTGNSKLSQFGKDYSGYAGGNIEIYFITGDESDMKAHKYVSGVETQAENPEINEDKIIFEFNGVNYEFDLEDGKNFYFVVSQNVEGEEYITNG